jgi:rod shape-determining protein MreD
MTKNIIWTVLFSFIATILQSTLLSHLALYHAVPDLALLIVIYAAYVNGTMTGQVSGFFSGILQDLLSSAPLGMNALIRTLCGALAGVMKGTFFLDVVFLPMILGAVATLVKAISLFILHLLFSGAVPCYSLTAPLFYIELLLNTVAAPFLFALLKLFPTLLSGRRDN